jgi:hypothetical protein
MPCLAPKGIGEESFNLPPQVSESVILAENGTKLAAQDSTCQARPAVSYAERTVAAGLLTDQAG